MLIHYRQYSAEEICAILTNGGGILYSRCNYQIRGKGKPDVIRVYIEKDWPTSNSRTIVFSFDVYNNLEAVQNELKILGFQQETGAVKLSKIWTLKFRELEDTANLLNNIMLILQEMLVHFPLQVYESLTMKALTDYHRFIRSSVTKIDHLKVMQDLGYWSEYYPENNIHADLSAKYLLSQYQKKYWAAWVTGDTIIPVFKSELQAETFLRDRIYSICHVRNITITQLLPYQRKCSSNLYVLSNPQAGLKQKIAWLQDEVARLHRIQAMYSQDETSDYVMQSIEFR